MLTVTLTHHEIQTIDAALGLLPYRQAAPVVASLQQKINAAEAAQAQQQAQVDAAVPKA